MKAILPVAKALLPVAIVLPAVMSLAACGKKEEAPAPAPQYREYSQPAEVAPATSPATTTEQSPETAVPAANTGSMEQAAPAPVPAPVAAAPEPQRYTVQKGDTLYRIATTHEVDVAELARWNHIDRPDMIRPGQELTVSAPQP